MRDIPVFATENGVASLTLKEIVYKQEAYIRLQDASLPEKLLEECIQFCVVAGAERVFASGHEILNAYPPHTTLIQMQCLRQSLPDTDAALFPVLENTFENWRQIYNDRMRSVPNAATVTMGDAGRIVKEGGAYFVHRGDTLLGIGLITADTVQAVASVVPGAGESVMLALSSALTEDTVTVEVAENNVPAIRLYERLGFVKTHEIARWFRVR